MTPAEISAQLESIAAANDFASCSAEFVDRWIGQGAGIEVVAPILRFMEEHPSIDFGAPGPLVHFVERFYRRGYEDHLVESVLRRPTAHTVWMLNRVVNGTKEPDARERLISVMRRARVHPLADADTKNDVIHFLERLGERH